MKYTRRKDIIETQVGDEYVVIDGVSAHCLPPTVGAIWKHLDQEAKSTERLADKSGLSASDTKAALQALLDKNLCQSASAEVDFASNRRDFLLTAGKVAIVTVAALPSVAAASAFGVGGGANCVGCDCTQTIVQTVTGVAGACRDTGGLSTNGDGTCGYQTTMTLATANTFRANRTCCVACADPAQGGVGSNCSCHTDFFCIAQGGDICQECASPADLPI